MENSKILKAYLLVAGVLLLIFGGGTLLDPIALKASFGIVIPPNVDVLNDVRAYSTLTFVFGVLSILGVFKKKLTYSASLIVFLQFLALGTGRAVSILIDGSPVEGNIIGMGNEFFFGIIGAILFLKYKRSSGEG